MREVIAWWGEQSNNASHAAVAEEVWAAAHGALRADDGSSCPGTLGGLPCLNGSHAREFTKEASKTLEYPAPA